jgi:hypothetical protein
MKRCNVFQEHIGRFSARTAWSSLAAAYRIDLRVSGDLIAVLAHGTRHATLFAL